MLPQTWAIRPEILPTALKQYARSFIDEIIEEESDKEIGEVYGSIGIIHICGILVPSLDITKLMGGFLPINCVKEQIQEYLESPIIDRIILSIDSPGGAVDGIYALAEFIRKSCQVKPIVAYVNDCACSGAYWLASACNAIYLASPTCQVGSIGVVILHEDLSEMLKEKGVKVTEIFSGKYKTYGSPYDALTKEEQAYIQAMTDKLYGIFVEKVAEYRGKDKQYVLENMADGRIFIGDDGVKTALADNIIVNVMDFMEVNSMGLFGKKPAMAQTQKKCEDQTQKDGEELYENENPIKKNEDVPEPGMKNSIQEALAQDRLRISAISEITDEGLETLAKKAVTDGWTVEKFAFEQTKAIKSRGLSMQQVNAGTNQNLGFSTSSKSEKTEKDKLISAIAEGMNTKRGTPSQKVNWQ